MHRAGWAHGPTAGPHATRRSTLSARHRVWRHVLPGTLRQQTTAEPVASGRCRRALRKCFQAAVEHPDARGPQGCAAVRGATANSGMRGTPVSCPFTAQPSMHNRRHRPAPASARSIRQKVTWAGRRIGASPRGTPATGSVLPVFALEDTRNLPIDTQAAMLFWRDGGNGWAAKAAPSPLQRSAGGHIADPCRAFGKHGPPPLPCPLCTTNLRTNHRTARSSGGLDGEDGMIEQKKRGCRPSRLLILPTGNDQVFTNPSSQLSKAW